MNSSRQNVGELLTRTTRKFIVRVSEEKLFQHETKTKGSEIPTILVLVWSNECPDGHCGERPLHSTQMRQFHSKERREEKIHHWTFRLIISQFALNLHLS